MAPSIFFIGLLWGLSFFAQANFSLTQTAREHSVRHELDTNLDRLVERAHQLIGVPYRWGGMSVKGGFDCSGLLVYLFRHEADIKIPRTTTAMLQSAARTIRQSQLKRGDAVFFNRNGQGRIGHVGLYIGEGRFIHAPRAGKNIRIDSLRNIYWSKSFMTAKRFHGG
ncbi:MULTISPECIES: C40 family peptidase [Pseudomonas]|uniref:C40 family peptidase n=1 Tax=Pseudomonas TaxID=286 RepID=UPI000299F9CD|nr:C40 family peptidase [Pseudomonas donghuensis]MBS7597491.1 C40 family peptidase [Pseudomonas sp. RC2C2]MCP6698445.1 C40 family peptidase [Pseudomonas donghuensis]